MAEILTKCANQKYWLGGDSGTLGCLFAQGCGAALGQLSRDVGDLCPWEFSRLGSTEPEPNVAFATVQGEPPEGPVLNKPQRWKASFLRHTCNLLHCSPCFDFLGFCMHVSPRSRSAPDLQPDRKGQSAHRRCGCCDKQYCFQTEALAMKPTFAGKSDRTITSPCFICRNMFPPNLVEACFKQV